jgi:hypothetical protein
MFQKKEVVETINTHFMFNNCFSKILPFMRKSGKILYSRRGHRWQYGACTLHAGYLSYKHTLRICNTYCCVIAKIVTRTRLNVTLYVQYSACLVKFKRPTGKCLATFAGQSCPSIVYKHTQCFYKRTVPSQFHGHILFTTALNILSCAEITTKKDINKGTYEHLMDFWPCIIV